MISLCQPGKRPALDWGLSILHTSAFHGLTAPTCAPGVDSADGAMQQYRGHEHSRESIELAYDRILQEKMNVRHKHGFKPVRTGRKTDVQGDADVRYTFHSALQLHVLCIRAGWWRL